MSARETITEILRLFDIMSEREAVRFLSDIRRLILAAALGDNRTGERES